VLTPYEYHVHLVELTDEEAEEYADLSLKIGRLAAGGTDDELEESSDSALQLLLFRRARLLGNARNKIEVLSRLLSGKQPEPFTLFYCGDGTTELEASSLEVGEERQVDQVSRLLAGLGWNVSTFTARESRQERRQILDGFRIADLHALVAIRCLDEGIDVPDCRSAYILASSRNPKQFIQRRGRILRRAPGKDSATVHDFLTLLPTASVRASDLEKRLLVAELSRVAEFATLATNFIDVAKELEPITSRYDLVHHLLAAT
jgi:superfamily II DNA or RNA helicase